MLQVTQKLINGTMEVLEAPLPSLGAGSVLVQNHYSLISAGTEGGKVQAARKSLIGKAKERPQQARQVVESLKSRGVVQTYRAVMKKLDAYSPLGYSCVGRVIDVAADVKGFRVGDHVACGGGSACHAEVVSVPVNLCVKLSEDMDLRQAAYNTLGAIALQGVRQADLRLGETCTVIGLGLLGQLSCLLLRAAGVRVVGVDIDQSVVDKAAKHSADLALNRSGPGVEAVIHEFTGGLGCDAVIITAASGSLDPINFAGAIARKQGTVVVVGAVPTGFDREPHYYQKELLVKMSCSYGPGRYDPNYEEKGLDYPPGYVRWTENRNMQAFQDLIHSRKIDVSYLTTHTFKLDDAPRAYDMMMARSEPFIGILIEYDTTKEIKRHKIDLRRKPMASCREQHAASIGFIGAGSYAQGHLLPNIPKSRHVCLKGVMTASSTGSRSAGERFGFEFCTSQADDILNNGDINTVFVATRHDSHAHFVTQGLKAGKNVFVEKPLCLAEEELDEITEILAAGESRLMVGYNRRFSPLTTLLKKELRNAPMAMTYRVNAGVISADSWIHDSETGGGRIIGEVCHFVDLLTFINGSLPVSVFATAMRTPGNLNDTLNVSLSYQNGSIGTVSYFANGDRTVPKERIEVYCNGCAGVLDDFRSLTVHSKGKKKTKKLLAQDKGQKQEIASFIDAITNGNGAPISFEEIYSASLVTFKIIESVRTGQSIRL